MKVRVWLQPSGSRDKFPLPIKPVESRDPEKAIDELVDRLREIAGRMDPRMWDQSEDMMLRLCSHDDADITAHIEIGKMTQKISWCWTWRD